MNSIAVDFIKAREGCRLDAYRDSAGVLTCGYGATGSDILPATVWTQELAEARLAADIASCELAVKRLVTIPLSEKQQAALISFCFNVGATAFEKSTLLSKLNGSDVLGAAKEFPRWAHAGGCEVKGLLIRRFEEATLFLQGS